MTSEKSDPREEPVFLLTPDSEEPQSPASGSSLGVAAREKMDLTESRRAIENQERIINEKVLQNRAIQQLDTGSFGGGFSRRDKGWLLLGFAFFYIVSSLLGYTPSVRTIIAGGILSAFLLFITVFLIEEFTKFRFPRIRIPIVDDLIYYAFDLIWNHRIISGGIIFGLLIASTFFIGTDWESPYDAARGTLEDRCTEKQWDSCVRLGDYYYHGIAEVKGGMPEKGKERDTAKAFTFYKKGCDGGNGKGCLGLWLLWGRKETYAIEREEALVLLKKSCTRGSGAACQIQEMYDRGIDLAGDPEALDALAADMAIESGIFLPSTSDDDPVEEL